MPVHVTRLNEMLFRGRTNQRSCPQTRHDFSTLCIIAFLASPEFHSDLSQHHTPPLLLILTTTSNHHRAPSHAIMLATAPWSPFTTFATSVPHHHQQAHQYTPPRPSPLSPRSANACPRPQFWSRNTMTSTRSATPASASDSENAQSAIPFAKRDIKTNPVLKRAKQTPDEARERRRGMFMKKVEQGREEGRWKGRSEQVCDASDLQRIMSLYADSSATIDPALGLHGSAPEVAGGARS